jgi:antitoxin CptB
MKELDELLLRFLEQEYEAAPPGHQEAFEQLLDLQDPDLYGLVTGASPPADAAMADVIERIRGACRP